eukprot:TRINITY_DN112609_c0_g1_i1.p1 TRINITY_DN112609_c0_g1~~TRINITY_DN112609_c0_g1_i1.p1  ORF type:complete len:253 (+),score=26.81 TRINITY_DN112609_c0_g1_i1:49-759(+)
MASEADFGARAKHVVKNNLINVMVSWVLGLLLVAFPGITVDEASSEAYRLTLQHAKEVTGSELQMAARKLRRAIDEVSMAQDEVHRLEKMRDQFINDARQEVGVWSTFGVQEVRQGYLAAWQSGMDVAFWFVDEFAPSLSGSAFDEASLTVLALARLFCIVMASMLGLVTSFYFFGSHVYTLIVAYGETPISGTVFFLLAQIAGVAATGVLFVAIPVLLYMLFRGCFACVAPSTCL